MSTITRYDANFTAGGLLYEIFRAIEDILYKDNFVELVIKEIDANNYIGIDFTSSRKRIIAEVIRRYNNVDKIFWHNYENWDENEKKLGLFYLCLITYPIVIDLHLEVSLKKYKIGASLNSYDIQMRIDEIISEDEEVSQWSPKTLDKINSQYRTTLKDAGLYDGQFLKEPTHISANFWRYFIINNYQWFIEACFKSI